MFVRHTHTHIARIIGVTSFLPSFRSFGRNSRKHIHTYTRRSHTWSEKGPRPRHVTSTYLYKYDAYHRVHSRSPVV